MRRWNTARMVDPITAVLSVYKTGTIASKAKGLLERFSRANTERFIAERDEMHREWNAETAGRLAEHITDSRKLFLELGATLDEHEERLTELFERHEIQLLAALYADAAYREVIAERRRMLSFAAATIIDLHLTIEEKAAIERVLRGLDPTDVLELHKLSRAVGKINCRSDGTGELFSSTDSLRYELLSSSVSDDALSAARCVREGAITSGGGAGVGVKTENVAYVTDRGALLLRVLRKYIDEKHDAFVGCGREEVPGSRSEAEARTVIGEVRGLVTALHAAADAARQLELWLHPKFEYAKPRLASGNGDFRKLMAPSHKTLTKLRLPAVPPQFLEAIPRPSSQSELALEVEDLPRYGRPAANVVLTGPHDVLRWLADDLDARWD